MKILHREFLPTTTSSVHAATVAMHKDHPVFSWFGGSREGSPDVAIYLYNLNNDQNQIIIGDNDNMPRWNPISNAGNTDQKLYLFTKAGAFCDRWQTFIHDITNWESDISHEYMAKDTEFLPAGLNGPVKTAPILVDINSLLCGSAVETFHDWASYIEEYNVDRKNMSFKFAFRSNPLFVKEKLRYNSISGRQRLTTGIIQPALFEHDECLHAFFRASTGLGKIYYSRPNILGDWQDPVPTPFDNPNSGVDVATVADRVFLVHNPSPTLRKPLVISEVNVSKEKRASEFKIKNSIVIREEVGDEARTHSKELSYPYMIADKDGTLHLVYTYGRSKIEYCQISID